MDQAPAGEVPRRLFSPEGPRLWPKIDFALHKIMKETVEPKIQDKVPYALKGLAFTKFTLGKTCLVCSLF